MKVLLFVLNKAIIKKHLFHFLNIVALFIMATMFLFSCQSKVAADIPPGLFGNNAVPSVEATDFELFYTDSGIVRYHLETPHVLVFEDEKKPYKDFPEGFRLQKYDKERKIISELSGNHGKHFVAENKWEATGNVILVNNNGDTLRTEELIFLEKEDKIFSDRFVSIKKGDQDITGKGGFESDTQMTKWTFRETKGHIFVKDK